MSTFPQNYCSPTGELYNIRHETHVISVNRGVKQGNPMSPILFNSVINYATSKMANHIYNYAISINNDLSKIKYMAFADDLVIFGQDQDSLQDQLNIVMKGLRDCGLDINESKCAAMNLIIHPKKMWICSPYNTICINDSKLKLLTIDDIYKYLCIDIGPIDNRKHRFVYYINVKFISISKLC